MLLIEADLELPSLLRHVVEEARSMAGARYGALGVLNSERTGLSEFVTSGLEPEQEAQIGQRPTGLGVLGLLISDPRTLRLSQLDTHPEAYGFPLNHPPMSSFLGVPIKLRDEVYGNLYLTDKIGWSEFTSDDQALVEALALAAGIAIENAQLHQRAKAAVVFEDRDRLARDLHDTVIQRLFAVGLSLQSMAGTAAAKDLQGRLGTAVRDIDDTIQQIRTAIFELGSADADLGIRSELLSLVRELETVLGFHVEVAFDGPLDTAISGELTDHLLAVLREALTNVGRHAQATEGSVTLSFKDSLCRLQIFDNGMGMNETMARKEGLGLVNMRRRAEKLRGEFLIETPTGGGTTIIWQVPLVQ
jgi:signal transduction histidine kinase